MRVIDSHTEGEPTRLIISGGPDLGTGTMAERKRVFAERFDHLRAFSLNEPRGFPAIVGALLCEPFDKSCDAGLIFYNNSGYLNMCGHGTIGAVVSLAWLGRLKPGTIRIDTPAGIVTAKLNDSNAVSIDNVPAFVHRSGVTVNVPGLGAVEGDVAWGGNWFFLTENAPCSLSYGSIPQLTEVSLKIKAALVADGITGNDGAEIDHIEIFGAPATGADSRSFVLCPGGEYDRSPCGTGTSAKLACLAQNGKLAAGKSWIQESIIGSRFEAVYSVGPKGEILPRITGRAWVTADATLVLQPADPFPKGIGAA